MSPELSLMNPILSISAIQRDECRLDVDAGGSWIVVDTDRYLHGLRDCLVVPIELVIGRLPIVDRHDQNAVGADAFRELGQPDLPPRL